MPIKAHYRPPRTNPSLAQDKPRTRARAAGRGTRWGPGRQAEEPDPPTRQAEEATKVGRARKKEERRWRAGDQAKPRTSPGQTEDKARQTQDKPTTNPGRSQEKARKEAGRGGRSSTKACKEKRRGAETQDTPMTNARQTQDKSKTNLGQSQTNTRQTQHQEGGTREAQGGRPKKPILPRGMPRRPRKRYFLNEMLIAPRSMIIFPRCCNRL